MAVDTDRLRELLKSYCLSAEVVDLLEREQVLNTRIKITSDAKSDKIYNAIGSDIAETIRKADGNFTDSGISGAVRSLACDFYFEDLQSKGNEWEYADLESEFVEQRELANDQLKYERENY